MARHRRYESAVSNDEAAGSYGQSKRNIQSIVRGVVNSHSDVEGGGMQTHITCRCWWKLGSQEFETFPSLVRREQFAAHLKP